MDDFNFLISFYSGNIRGTPILQENISLISDILEMTDTYPRTRRIYLWRLISKEKFDSIDNCF